MERLQWRLRGGWWGIRDHERCAVTAPKHQNIIKTLKIMVPFAMYCLSYSINVQYNEAHYFQKPLSAILFVGDCTVCTGTQYDYLSTSGNCRK